MREAQLAQYNYILVVGEEEKKAQTVNVRTRDNVVHGMFQVRDLFLWSVALYSMWMLAVAEQWQGGGRWGSLCGFVSRWLLYVQCMVCCMN